MWHAIMVWLGLRAEPTIAEHKRMAWKQFAAPALDTTQAQKLVDPRRI